MLSNTLSSDHINLEVNDLPDPSEPSRSIHLSDHGDVKAFAVRQYHMAGANSSLVSCGSTSPVGLLSCNILAALKSLEMFDTEVPAIDSAQKCRLTTMEQLL